MIELLVGGGVKANNYFPDSGPGTKTLQYGDENLGYFGTLTFDEFMSHGDLRKQLNFFTGVAQNGAVSNQWVKAIYNKKVIFFPRIYIGGAYTWNAMYDAGLVYGVDGPGNFQGPNGPVNQQRIVSAKGSNFRVRLFNGDKTDPTSLSSTFNWGAGSTQPGIDINLSEFGTMLNSLKVSPPLAWPGPKWGVLAGDSFFNGVNGLLKQTLANNNNNFMYASASVGVAATAKASGSYSWIPVLELIPANEVILYPMINVEDLPVSELVPVIVTEIIQDVGLRAIRDPALLATGLDAVHSVTITYS